MKLFKKLSSFLYNLQGKSSPGNDSSGEASDVSRVEMYNQIRQEENQRYLDELLSQKRSADLDKRLRAVLKHETDILKKIDIVEAVDRRGAEVLAPYEARINMVNKKKESAAQKRAYKFEKPGDIHLEGLSPEDSNASSSSLQPTTLGQYLFHEFGRISAFGRANQLLKPQMLFLRHNLTPALRDYWNVELKVALQYLEGPSKRLFLEGWKILEIEQYNLVVLLYGIISQFFEKQLLIFDKRVSSYFMTRLKGMLALYLKLASHPDSSRKLIEAFTAFQEAGLDKPKKDSKENHLDQISSFITRLLDTNRPGPGLANCLRALMMAENRKYFSFEDLVKHFVHSNVSDTRYQCPDSMLARIKLYLGQQQKKLKTLEEKLQLFSEVEHIPDNMLEDTVCMELHSLYTGEVSEDDTIPPAQSCMRFIQYDIISFLEKTATSLSEKASALLVNHIMTTDGSTRLFPYPMFGALLDALNQTVQSIYNIRIGHEHLTIDLAFYQSFVHNTKRGSTFTETEKNYCFLAQSIADAAYQLAAKLNRIIRRNKFWAQLPPEKLNRQLAEAANPDEYTRDFKKTIQEPAFFRGISVHDALQSLFLMNLGLALLLEEPRLQRYLAHRQELAAEITQKREDLERFRGFSSQAGLKTTENTAGETGENSQNT